MFRRSSAGFLAALPVPAQCIDAQSRISAVDQEWLDLLGYTPDEVIGQPLAAFLTADSAGRLTPMEAAHPIQRTELCFVTKESGPIDVLVSARALNESARPVTLAVLSDLRPVRRAELESRQNAEQYGKLVENVTEYAVYLISADGRISSWNAGAQRMISSRDAARGGSGTGPVKPRAFARGWENGVAPASFEPCRLPRTEEDQRAPTVSWRSARQAA